MISMDDLHTCENQKKTLKNIKVKKLSTFITNDISITSGKRFSVHFYLYDQYGAFFCDTEKKHVFLVSLNTNNEQGAVLWGVRTNTSSSSCGVLEFNSLIISQPGVVEFKVGYKINEQQQEKNKKINSDLKILEIFTLYVNNDPTIIAYAPCIYVFKESFCPLTTQQQQNDWLKYFPKIRSFSSSQKYLQNLFCVAYLREWFVDAFLNADGSMWIEYRVGIDSIWTGIGLPRVEMSYGEKLGLSLLSNTTTTTTTTMMTKKTIHRNNNNSIEYTENNKQQENNKQENKQAKRKQNNLQSLRKKTQKKIKRAYYKQSLQWHPDRWTSMPIYSIAVQGAFELISEAYQFLLNDANNMNKANNNNKVVNNNAHNAFL